MSPVTDTATIDAAIERRVDELLDGKDFALTGQVAALLGVCKMTVHRMMQAGELSGYRWPRETSPYRIPRTELLRLLRAAWVEPPQSRS